jgi:glucokinase
MSGKRQERGAAQGAGKLFCAIGIDLGGTRIKALSITPAGQVLRECAAPTGETGQGAWVQNVLRAVQRLWPTTNRGVLCIGVAAPGLPRRSQDAIAYMPGRLPGLEGLVWRDLFGSKRPVPVLNDSHAALLGETWLGAARGSRNVVLLTLGTGVGGAAMVDGHLLRGHIGRAGHLGHVSLDPAGPLDITNTPGSLEEAIGDCTVEQRSGGRFRSTADLVAASRRGDAEAVRVWRMSVQALAAAMSSLINVLDPEVMVIGGGIANAGPALFRPLARFMNQFEWRPGGHKVRILPAKLGDRAGAFGAAWKAMQNGYE